MASHNNTIGGWTPADLQRFVVNHVLPAPVKPNLPVTEPWVELSAAMFSSPWTNFDPGPVWRPAKYTISHGVVHLRGLVASGTTGANGQTIFTLPERYRPLLLSSVTGMVFRTVCWNGVAAVFGSIEIHSDGRVTPYSSNVFGAGTGLWLDGISFVPAQ